MCVDRRIGGRMNGWVNGCVDECTDGWLDAWLGECVCWLLVGSRPAGALAWRKARKPIGRGLWRGLISRKPNKQMGRPMCVDGY